MRLFRKSRAPDDHPIAVIVNGKRLVAIAGESVVSALLTNGIETFSLSLKSSAPRAPFCFMGACQDCTVRVNGRSVLACQTLVEDGMRIDVTSGGHSNGIL